MPITPSSRVVIVGSGCFGISTALHLLKRGYTDVVVLDRAPVVPAPDAASTDLNKIVRSSYHDAFYTHLAREAIAAWKDRDEWGEVYQESGVLVLGSGESIYADGAYVNDIASGARVKNLVVAPDEDALNGDKADVNKSKSGGGMPEVRLRELFPPGVTLGPKLSGSNVHGYLNEDGGWAYAEGGVARAIELVRARGGVVLAGKEVVELLKSDSSVSVTGDGSRTTGVRCKDQTEYMADVVVLATGSWTASAFPELDLGEKCLATGQSLATVQLTPEEAQMYRSTPVVLDFGPSGFYVFPPNEHNIVKFAKHAGGYTNFLPSSDNPDAPKISTPRTILSHGEDGLRIPKSEAKILRDNLTKIYPVLGEKPFTFTRLCWYTDSPDSDWMIDIHPEDPGLALATSGSGHGYKFLPVIGRLIADRLEDKMEPEVQKKFALSRPLRKHDLYRDGAVVGTLNVDDLCDASEA